MDLPTRCAITYRRNEKVTCHWFINTSKMILDIMDMTLEDAKVFMDTKRKDNHVTIC